MGMILNLLGLEETAAPAAVSAEGGNAADYAADVFPPSWPRPATSLNRALSLPACYRSIVLTASMAGQLTLEVRRNGETLPITPALIAQPDPWRELSSWIERVVVGLATDGNAFLRKIADPLTGAVISLEVLDPFRVVVRRHPVTGIKTYAYSDRATGKTTVYTAGEIEHLWGLEVPGLDRGLGPIGHCRVALTGALDLREYADKWFGAPDVPSGVLSTDQRLTGPEATAYRERWYETAAGPNGGPGVRILGAGLSYEPIMLRPADAQWLEAQSFGVLDIARMWGMPADYLLVAVENSSMTYRTTEAIDAQFLRTTLFPLYLRKIEAALTAVLPRGQSARFRTEALLRPDAKTRAEIAKVYVDSKILEPDEVRPEEYGPRPRARERLREDTPA